MSHGFSGRIFAGAGGGPFPDLVIVTHLLQAVRHAGGCRDRWDRSWCFALIKHRFPRTTPSDRGGFYNTHSNAFYFSRASATNFFIHFVRGLPTLINRAAIPPEIAANTFYSTTRHRDIFYIGASSRIRIAHGSSSPSAVPPPAMLSGHDGNPIGHILNRVYTSHAVGSSCFVPSA